MSPSRSSSARRLEPLELGVVIVAALVVLLALGAFLFFRTTRPPAGEYLHRPAMDFSLLDQQGSRFDLASADGKVVVLTFMFTHCGDECPFTAEKLKAVYGLLSPTERKGVELVVVSSDPVGDTLDRVAAYSRALGMYDRWRYLVGDREQLSPIWRYYDGLALGVGGSRGRMGGGGIARGLDASALREAGTIAERFAGGPDVDHPTTIWLIGRSHTVDIATDADATPEALAADVAQLEGNPRGVDSSE